MLATQVLRQIPVATLILARRTCVSTLPARRASTAYRSGALKPKPDEIPFGIVGVVCAVLPGLFIGAAISKSVANFLEENDLFVPSEDDDDDD